MAELGRLTELARMAELGRLTELARMARALDLRRASSYILSPDPAHDVPPAFEIPADRASLDSPGRSASP